MVEQTVSGYLISGIWDLAVWGGAVFVVLVWLGFNLGSKMVKGDYRPFVGLGLFGLLVGLVCWTFLVVFGLVRLEFLFLISGLLLALCVVFSVGFFGISRLSLVLKVLLSSVFVVLFFEVAALVLFNVPVALGFGGSGLHWGSVELSFANLGYPFLPYVYLLFVLLGVAAFVIKVLPEGWLIAKLRDNWFVGLVGRVGGVFESMGDGGFEFLRGRFVVVLAVVVSAVVSCLFVVFTVLPWANPTNMLVSVDSPVYNQWISYMRSVDINSALSFAFANDRAVFLVLCYALSFFASSVSVIQFVAALLIVMFSVVSLLVLRLLCKSRVVWIFGVLIVPFSFQSLGLIYSGYFANMLALIFIFAYAILFFRVIRSWSSIGFFGLLGVSVLVLFSHSWTWFVFALTLGAFLFLEWRLAVRERGLWRRFKLEAILVGATVSLGLISDLARKMSSPVSAPGSVLSTAQSSLGLPNGAFLLNGLRESVEFALGGVFANVLLVFLSVIGFLVLFRFKSSVSNFIFAWIFVACISILFATSDFVFNRFLFMMPWVILSSFGLLSVARLAMSQFGDSKGWRFSVVLLVLGFVFLVLLNSSLRYLFNINVW